nr:Lar family restriction alleviation protein [Providencia stuartii]ELR5081576.1 Lar family restriction alleviation protein [Providencia stuartii]
MDMNKYLVTYLGDYPCGHRHTLSMEIHALGVSDAIEKSEELLADEDIKSINHSLYSVVPVGAGLEALAEINMCPPRSEIALLPCPFCGNDEIDMNYSYWAGEYMYVIRCSCCGTQQMEEDQHSAVRVWNQREALSTTEAK